MLDFLLKKSSTIIMVTMAILLGGLIAINMIPKTVFPDVKFATISIEVAYPGASAEDIELTVTQKIEDSLKGLSDLEKVTSDTRNNSCFIMAQFKIGGIDDDKALQLVKNRVDAIKSDLPKDAKEPRITTFTVDSFPIVTYSISSDKYSKQELTDLLKDVIKPEMEKIPGVSTFNIVGGYDRQVTVEAYSDKLVKYGISIMDIQQAINNSNLNFPGGRLSDDKTEIYIRTMGEAKTAKDLENLVVPLSKYTGAGIRLGDLAKVTDGEKEIRSKTFVNSTPAIVFSITKKNTGNAVNIVQAADKILDKMNKSGTINPNIKINKILDNTDFIIQSNQATFEAMILGAFLAIIIIFVFLKDWKATFVSSVAIPVSLAGTFIYIKLAGFNIDMMSLLALSLVIGILVDDAIVAIEAILRYIKKGTMSITEAISAAMNEVKLPMTAATLTIVAVFTPVAFMGGVVGMFFREFGLTVAVAVLISLVVAIILTPLLTAKLYGSDPDKIHLHEPGKIATFFMEKYSDLIVTVIKHPYITLAITFAVFFGSFALTKFIPTDFVPKQDRGVLDVIITMPPDSSVTATGKVSSEIDNLIRSKHKEVSVTLLTYGDRPDAMGANNAKISLKFVPKHDRKKSTNEVASELRKEMEPYIKKGAKINIVDPFVLADPDPRPIQLIFTSANTKTLDEWGPKLLNIVQNTKGLVDVELKPGDLKTEYNIIPNQVAALDSGVNIRNMAVALNYATVGMEAAKITLDNKQYDVWLKTIDANNANLKDTMVPSHTQYGAVPLSAVASIHKVQTNSMITRNDYQRVITIYANNDITNTGLGDAVKNVKDALAKANMPKDLSYKLGGDADRQADMMVNMLIAIFVAIIAIYIILVNQFESFTHPFTVLSALPFAVVGAFIGLLAFHQSMGLMAMIGIILLMGLVTKNSILLVDYAKNRMETGDSPGDAIMKAGKIRFTPIVMTSMAMVVGMLPIAFAFGEGAEGRAPMGATVAGGLVFSTLLTLIVVPAIFILIEKMRTFVRGNFRKLMKRL